MALPVVLTKSYCRLRQSDMFVYFPVPFNASVNAHTSLVVFELILDRHLLSWITVTELRSLVSRCSQVGGDPPGTQTLNLLIKS